MTSTAEEFDREFPAYRRELVAHCYRMTGSFHDAEDLVQETYVRGRRGIGSLTDPAALRGWLYTIATNVCLTALHPRQRRVLPSGLGAPATDPDAPLVGDAQTLWIEPFAEAAADPGDIVVRRESVRLALIVALQHLAPRQRAALLLREVLGWSAAEIASALEITAPAVKSLLQRARAQVDELAPATEQVAAADDPDARALLDRWTRAFAAGDVDTLGTLMADDFSIEATTCRTWFRGKDVCIPFLRRSDVPGVWRTVAVIANGQPAAALYRRGDDGSYRAFAISVLSIIDGRVARVNDFLDAELMITAGLPATLDGVDHD